MRVLSDASFPPVCPPFAPKTMLFSDLWEGEHSPDSLWYLPFFRCHVGFFFFLLQTTTFRPLSKSPFFFFSPTYFIGLSRVEFDFSYRQKKYVFMVFLSLTFYFFF